VSTNDQQQLDSFLNLHPEIERIEVLLLDMSGVFRGKSLPVSATRRLTSGRLRFPLSFYMGDIWGHDVDAAGLAIDLGDPDAEAHPIMLTLTPVPWAIFPTVQVIMSLYNDDGSRVVYDSRAQLQPAVDRLAKLGLKAHDPPCQ
jgi:glutamine synthetase